MKLNRRGFALGAACAALTPSPAAADAEWSFERAQKAWADSGRESGLTSESFDAIQRRKPNIVNEVEILLRHHFGAADPAILQAFRDVPREYYHYHYGRKAAFATEAYEPNARPWSIGLGSALSDYRGQLYMTQLAGPTRESTALEIGTGSGYQISLLSRIVKQAYSIEIVEPLGKAVGRIFKPLGYDNLQTRVGDGYYGWTEVEGGFDVIIVTCVAQHVPPPLFQQLKPGGKLVIPIGQPFKREQFLYVFSKDADGKIHSRKDIGIYFIPMTGRAMAQQDTPKDEPARKSE